MKPIVCYSCNEVGHKAPQCLLRKKDKVKKVTISADQVETLDTNDVMASVNGQLVPITIDSGAKVSIVPEESVQELDFVGETLKFKSNLSKCEWTEAQVANVPITIGSEFFVEKVLAVPGDDLGWTGVLRVDCSDPLQWSRIAKLMEWKKSLPESHKRYIPSTSQDGLIKVQSWYLKWLW